MQTSNADSNFEENEEQETSWERAHRCFALWQGLEEREREELRFKARENVPASFWDRLEAPDSPMSLTLWDLVAEKFSALDAIGDNGDE